MCDHVQVLSQEKAQLLKEAAHAQNVQQLYEKVKDQTHEVQRESQRVRVRVRMRVRVRVRVRARARARARVRVRV